MVIWTLMEFLNALDVSVSGLDLCFMKTQVVCDSRSDLKLLLAPSELFHNFFLLLLS